MLCKPLSDDLYCFNPKQHLPTTPKRFLDCQLAPIPEPFPRPRLRQSPIKAMSLNRTGLRGVLFYDVTKPDEVLGGLWQNGPISEATFLDIRGIFLIVWFPLRVQKRTSSHIVSRINVPLATGEYDIYSQTPVEVSDEIWVEHATTHNVTGRNERFRWEVRDCDRGCVISGLINPESHIQTSDPKRPVRPALSTTGLTQAFSGITGPGCGKAAPPNQSRAWPGSPAGRCFK
ncbi:hypothetical protein HOY80DRAFT_1088307 [Tuber brumale]|nr:hypothetical protein HOY80DRAFT_1088307 [Tuber brumale]